MSARTISFNSHFVGNSTGPHTYSVEKLAAISAIAGSPDGQLIAAVGRDS